jgi:hypothetical protein
MDSLPFVQEDIYQVSYDGLSIVLWRSISSAAYFALLVHENFKNPILKFSYVWARLDLYVRTCPSSTPYEQNCKTVTVTDPVP